MALQGRLLELEHALGVTSRLWRRRSGVRGGASASPRRGGCSSLQPFRGEDLHIPIQHVQQGQHLTHGLLVVGGVEEAVHLARRGPELAGEPSNPETALLESFQRLDSQPMQEQFAQIVGVLVEIEEAADSVGVAG